MAVKIITSENFVTETEESKITIVDFWAPWCGYCRRITPFIDQIAEEYKDDFNIGKVNIDEQPGLAEQYEVMTIPTLIAFQNGKPVGEPLVAPTAKSTIESWMKELQFAKA